MPDDRDDLLHRLSHFRDKQFAQLVTMVIGLAAEQHPEELKRALATVFNLERVEEECGRIARTSMLILQDTDEARQNLIAFNGKLAELEKELAELRKTVAKSQEYLTNGKHSGPRVRG